MGRVCFASCVGTVEALGEVLGILRLSFALKTFEGRKVKHGLDLIGYTVCDVLIGHHIHCDITISCLVINNVTDSLSFAFRTSKDVIYFPVNGCNITFIAMISGCFDIETKLNVIKNLYESIVSIAFLTLGIIKIFFAICYGVGGITICMFGAIRTTLL